MAKGFEVWIDWLYGCGILLRKSQEIGLTKFMNWRIIQIKINIKVLKP